MLRKFSQRNNHTRDSCYCFDISCQKNTGGTTNMWKQLFQKLLANANLILVSGCCPYKCISQIILFLELEVHQMYVCVERLRVLRFTQSMLRMLKWFMFVTFLINLYLHSKWNLSDFFLVEGYSDFLIWIHSASRKQVPFFTITFLWRCYAACLTIVTTSCTWKLSVTYDFLEVGHNRYCISKIDTHLK